jgi:hypothetical protein
VTAGSVRDCIISRLPSVVACNDRDDATTCRNYLSNLHFMSLHRSVQRPDASPPTRVVATTRGPASAAGAPRWSNGCCGGGPGGQACGCRRASSPYASWGLAGLDGLDVPEHFIVRPPRNRAQAALAVHCGSCPPRRVAREAGIPPLHAHGVGTEVPCVQVAADVESGHSVPSHLALGGGFDVYSHASWLQPAQRFHSH